MSRARSSSLLVTYPSIHPHHDDASSFAEANDRPDEGLARACVYCRQEFPSLRGSGNGLSLF